VLLRSELAAAPALDAAEPVDRGILELRSAEPVVVNEFAGVVLGMLAVEQFASTRMPVKLCPVVPAFVAERSL
jgi:hypothetical protein